MDNNVLLISGSTNDIHRYDSLIDTCDRHTNFDIYSPNRLEEMFGEDEDLYGNAMTLVENSKFIIIDMSDYSMNQATILKMANDKNISTILISKYGVELPSIINGMENIIDIIEYQNKFDECCEAIFKYFKNNNKVKSMHL